MPPRSDWSGSVCPIARSLEVVGDPWVLLILRNALLGTRHYERFRDELGIADNVLSRRLQAMVDAGLLRQVPYRGPRRTHLEYHLIEAGEDLLPVLQALALVHKRGRELAAGGPVPPAEVAGLAEMAAGQERALRSLILRDPDQEATPAGAASLRAALTF